MKKLVSFVTVFLMINAAVFATTANASHVNIQYLTDKTVFPGDQHGDFTGNFVAVISDGSMWKVHPKDAQAFYGWNINDPVYLQIRTSHYWFKREHKFEMFNAANNQSVRVMLTAYPAYPYIIVFSETYWVDTIISVTEHKEDDIVYYDEDGNILYVHEGQTYYLYHYDDIYEKMIVLNDGSRWVLKNESKFDHYKNGNYVYFLLQGGNYHLISGIQREAVHTAVYEVIR